MKLFQNVLFFLVGSIVAASCVQNEPDGEGQQQEAEKPKLSYASKAIWNKHMGAVSFAKIQPECRPRRYAAQGDLKGIVVLFHGYSACPQQFWEIAPLLAEKGFEVYLPLLPGHGLKKIVNGSKVKDDLSLLPTAGKWFKYTDLADSMTEMAKLNEGVRHVVGGLSVGGALATYSAMAPQHAGVWNRSLIMAPLYSGSEGLQLSVLDTVARLPLLDRIGYGWGPGCVKDSTLSPKWAWNRGDYTRGGICDFQVTHLGAVQSLGDFTKRLILRKYQSSGPLAFNHHSQLVNTETDAKSRPKSLIETNDWLSKISARTDDGKVTLRHSSCTWDESVPHSFISRFDWPEIPGDSNSEKKWLRGMILDAVKYITIGAPFPSSGASTILPGHAKCTGTYRDPTTYSVTVPDRESDELALQNSQY